MPQIFDNIQHHLLSGLRQTLEVAHRADFCVGYFNLRGWTALYPLVDRWEGGEGHCCRLLVGMQRLPEEELRAGLTTKTPFEEIDNQTALRLKKRLAEAFRTQLTFGAPNNEDEFGLRQLARQLRAGQVVVKLFLRHPLHAKLYLLFRNDPINPTVGYLGSSNLTMAGLASQGELNVDVLDRDACAKLTDWFNQRWDDRWCVDISAELAQIIEKRAGRGKRRSRRTTSTSRWPTTSRRRRGPDWRSSGYPPTSATGCSSSRRRRSRSPPSWAGQRAPDFVPTSASHQ
jgi:hypothetical protein